MKWKHFLIKILSYLKLCTKEETIDYHAGIYLNKKTGEEVAKDEVVMTLYTNRYVTTPVYDWAKRIFRIVTTKPQEEELVYEIIQ